MVNVSKEHLQSLRIKNEALNGLLGLLCHSDLDNCIEVGSYIDSEDSLVSLFENDLTSQLIVCLRPFDNEFLIWSQLL